MFRKIVPPRPPLLAMLIAFIVLGGGLAAAAAGTDGDGDGFDDADELFIGTDETLACNATSTANDEAVDAWPPDFNDDLTVNISDVITIRNHYGALTGAPLYSQRYDLVGDGQVGLLDVLSLRENYGVTCDPVPTVPPAANENRIHWQGQDHYLHGANVPWFNWSCDFGCGAGGGASSASAETDLRSGFQQLEDAGIHAARWWTFPGNPWQIDVSGNGTPTGLNDAIYADFDAALALAEDYDLYFVFTLFSSPADLPSSWLTDPVQRAALANVLGELFDHYSDDPRAMTWQIFNEPEWSIWNNEVTQASVQATVEAIADSIHANSNAYASVGAAMLDGLPMWTDLGLDYYTAHWYDYMASGNWCALCTDYDDVKDRYDLDAPLVIGEFYAGPDTDALERFEDWYDKGYAGAFAWSLFYDHTSDFLQIDMDAAETFGGNHSDIGP